MSARHSLDRRSTIDGGLLIAVGPARETCLVTLVGELDLTNAPTLRKELHGLLAMELETVVLDLSRLSSSIRAASGACWKRHSNREQTGTGFRFLDSLHPHVDRILRALGNPRDAPFHDVDAVAVVAGFSLHLRRMTSDPAPLYLRAGSPSTLDPGCIVWRPTGRQFVWEPQSGCTSTTLPRVTRRRWVPLRRMVQMCACPAPRTA